AKKWFKQGSVFMSEYDKTRAWANILKDVSQNVLEDVNKKTSTWLDNFNSKIKEAHLNVKVMTDAYEQMVDRRYEEKKNDYIKKYTDDLFSKLNISFGEELSEAEKIEERMKELEEKIKVRAEESALLDYRL